MNIVFFGNPLFAAKSLEYLNDMKNLNIKLVVTNIDKKMGRGLKKQSTPVKKTALKYSNKILETDNPNSSETINILKKINADLFIIVAYRYLNEKVYSYLKYGAINLHASLLPKYRGASPIQYSIMNGDKETGLTTFFINKKIDQGKIIYQQKYILNERDQFQEVYSGLTLLSKDVLTKTINIISSGDIPAFKNQLKASQAPKILKEDFIINWNNTSCQIHNKIRALSYKGAYTHYIKKRIKFFDTSYTKNIKLNIKAGEFYYKKNKLYINTGEGELIVSKVQLEGGKIISATDFSNTFKKDFNTFE
ncbi:MAG: methionyl-tRNA formyltransferase [Candidatus Marinimicrobia bacterium]|nr:methionyl-tRNA formyltransferase [Candidatus Neomarinimicrobiota bacterium]|tara:strand:+ start:16477 stop:17397 length:921 start_codon:yes stop_codon:yes gene_type:complete